VAEPLLLPEYGPSLPQLARRRFGWRERTTVGVLVAVAVAVALSVIVVRRQADAGARYVHHGQPVFNLVYDTSRLHRVTPQGDELVRLQGHRGRLSTTIAITRLALPPARGDVAHGLLPVVASQRIRELAAQHPDFALRAEARTRLNGAPGYEIRFQTGPPAQRTFGNDLLLLPSEREPAGALLATARREVDGAGRLHAREKSLDKATGRAYRSLTYGTAATQ
jgi:hypothetical protein